MDFFEDMERLLSQGVITPLTVGEKAPMNVWAVMDLKGFNKFSRDAEFHDRVYPVCLLHQGELPDVCGYQGLLSSHPDFLAFPADFGIHNKGSPLSVHM